MIKIVADSTCDLPKELVEQYGVQIAPLHIVLGEKEVCHCRWEYSPARDDTVVLNLFQEP